MNKRQSWNITAVFLLLIFGFTAASILSPKRASSERENRPLAQLPKLTAASVLDGTFESDYEDYLTDQFFHRDDWITLYTDTERASGRTEVNEVYFAKDDYLIEKHVNTFTTDRAGSNITFLSQFAQKMASSYDADHFTIMVIPNAVDILRDKLPPYAAPYDEEDYLSMIRDAVPGEAWFDASAVLNAHNQEEIYYRTDHHWETLGAYYVFAAWAQEKGLGQVSPDQYEVETVSDTFEGTVAAKVGGKVHEDSIEVYRQVDEPQVRLVYNQSDDVRSTMYQASKLDTRDQYAYFFGGNYGLIQCSTNAGTGRRLLVIKDSYAHCFAPFLMDRFDQVDLLDLRYFNQSLSQFMEDNDYTDVLFLYNASGFAEDTSLVKLTV